MVENSDCLVDAAVKKNCRSKVNAVVKKIVGVGLRYFCLGFCGDKGTVYVVEAEANR